MSNIHKGENVITTNKMRKRNNEPQYEYEKH